jgi:hypothetical protein
LFEIRRTGIGRGGFQAMVDQALIRRYLRLRLELEPECVEDSQGSVEFGPRLSVQRSLFLRRRVTGMPDHVISTHKTLITRGLFKPPGDYGDER